ncbi:MAG TPA: hypothetical protein PLH02_00870 [Bacillota bacterium]|nr:hypothetical protein [Bacillota bacterium]HPF41897.1 hypothetical protein [Bacillota bacterium]HPQ61418.1 hypothetical protein [Bacillota bacterium]HRX91306.1 hypothetical protein [Candidatus Izemoplasmatales bacterium]
MSFFSSTCETRELHIDSGLRTRYYRNSFKQCLAVIEEYSGDAGTEIVNVNQAHGEIHMVGSGYDSIITITQLTPLETGIDIKINFFTSMGFNRPKKKVMEMYAYFDHKLNFKGVSLHP